jgi:hypothetical protein
LWLKSKLISTPAPTERLQNLTLESHAININL